MTVTNQRLVEILTTAMDKPEIANALIQRVINTLNQQPEPEPVAWLEFERYMDEDGLMSERKILHTWDNCKGIPLYTAPPQREWQGLTDEEIKEIIGPWGDQPVKGYTRKLFDQIESKLREKNT